MKYLRAREQIVGDEEVEVIEWQPEYNPLTLQPIYGAVKGFFVVSGPDGPEVMVAKGRCVKPGTKFIVNADGSLVPLTEVEVAALKPWSQPPAPQPVEMPEPDASKKVKNKSS